jgi:hypothetical protein
MCKASLKKQGITHSKQKEPLKSAALHIPFQIAGLFRMNSLNRAYISTCTTIGADIRINFINITFRYSLYGTLINTGSACCAIFTDFVSHFYNFLVKVITTTAQIYPKFLK